MGIMEIVLVLALAGLFLIYLEFALPGGIMAIGGALLLLSSIFLFYMGTTSHPYFMLYILILAVALFSVVKIALWKFPHRRKEAESPPPTSLEGMVGRSATTATDLTPHGQIFIGEELFDAQ